MKNINTNPERLSLKSVEKDSSGTGLIAKLNSNKEDDKAEFSFEMSVFKGIKIKSKGYEREMVAEIIKSLFSPKRPIFWLIISKAVAIIFFVIKHSDILLDYIKSPP